MVCTRRRVLWPQIRGSNSPLLQASLNVRIGVTSRTSAADLNVLSTIALPKEKLHKYSMIIMPPAPPPHCDTTALLIRAQRHLALSTQRWALKPKAGSSDQIKKPRELLVSPLPSGARDHYTCCSSKGQSILCYPDHSATMQDMMCRLVSCQDN